MAERKLNINAPLMSVRRTSAMPPSIAEAKRRVLEKRQSLPNLKPDSSLDQVTEPVAVPFNWEHIPGRRKGNGGYQPQPPVEASIVTSSPRLPPGKSTKSGELPLRKECTVANKFMSSNKSNSFTGAVVKVDCDKERKEESRVSNVNDDDDDDVYSDALDRLSHTESFSMNCSISGVSGLGTLDAKNSGTFSTDQQTRDFMMSRFLPAAKAMTLQPSQYASKKQSVAVVEQPREVKQLVRDEKRPLLLKHVSDIIPYFGQSLEEEEESEDEVEDYNDSANNLAKGCGVFSQLRLKNSLCLLNPVPGMKMRNELPLPSANESGKTNKTSRIRSYSPIPAVKKAWDAISKNKSSSRAISPEKPELRRKWTSESNRFTFSGELQPPGRLSPFRRSRAAAAGVSPCRSKPQSPLRGARLPGKEAENNQAAMLNIQRRVLAKSGELPPQAIKNTFTSISPAIEKTLYIDTASTVKLSGSNSSSVGITNKIDIDVGELDKRKEAENRSTIEPSQDTKHAEAMEKKNILDSEVPRSLDANSSTFSGMLHHRTKQDKAEELVSNQETKGALISSTQKQGHEDTDSVSDINNLQIVLVHDSRSGPLPPPLPKSPTESWLWHALPKVSLRNSNTRAQTPTKMPESNTASSNAKWETIVKTSNLHHDHVRYSQELTTHVSQHLKSKR
ncbi:hypothetical protein L6164_017449 [Bauhinia variegata]|uniref:Uncharacterized protein n=1 Tax=Bauhinia variegata TaxID=167791 RepID=A0ACB9NBH1_BAUVA|nr:hypothetical protein L6164_017449 [Bauhinia variegata]